MTLTRKQGVDAFKHVLEIVSGLSVTDDLMLALDVDRYNNITDLATLTNKEIDGFSYPEEYKDTNGADQVCIKPVVKKQCKQLLHLLSWRDWKSKQLNTFELKHWMELTQEDFHSFCSDILPDIIRGTSKGTVFPIQVVVLVVSSLPVKFKVSRSQ